MQTAPAPATAAPRWQMTMPLSVIAGVGPATAGKLARQGIATIGDLLSWFPRRWQPLRPLAAPCEDAVGEPVRLRGRVRGSSLAWLPGRRAMVTVRFACADGTPFEVRFFNQPWLRNSWQEGAERVVEGVLQAQNRRFVLQQARVLPPDAVSGSPVQLRYAEIEGLGEARLRQWLQQCLQQVDFATAALPPLPRGLADWDRSPAELFRAMHEPADVAEHERARRHFALREVVALFARFEQRQQARRRLPAVAVPLTKALERRICARIPFAFTADQQRAVHELTARLAGPGPMAALLQGDVGTGKTAVALYLALAAIAAGLQVAFLAPTELLAEQHWLALGRWLQGSDVEVLLCTGSGKAKDRQAVQARIAAGGAQLVFGTHALFAEQTAFARLGLVIVDEQHRFGVEQRLQMVHKGRHPHLLVMSATPIPRTLAMTLFGDLDVVSLRERPPGRRPVPARHVVPGNWSRVLRSMQRAVARGGGVFVVCPAVGEDGGRGGAVRMQVSLEGQFRCGLVHGRMPADERQRVIAAFHAREFDVLVGTTVLEVGIDVPHAVLMVVAAAERFGLATLHQLRGRVGRGGRRGLCIVCGEPNPRLDALCKTMDGFELAELDLQLRGSGELLGTAQSGFGDLRAFDPVTDLELLQQARAAVKVAK